MGSWRWLERRLSTVKRRPGQRQPCPRDGSRELERVKIHRLRAIHANKGLSGNPNLVRGQRIPLSPRASPASSRSPRELRSHLDRFRQRCYVRGARGHPKGDRLAPGKPTSGQPASNAAPRRPLAATTPRTGRRPSSLLKDYRLRTVRAITLSKEGA